MSNANAYTRPQLQLCAASETSHDNSDLEGKLEDLLTLSNNISKVQLVLSIVTFYRWIYFQIFDSLTETSVNDSLQV